MLLSSRPSNKYVPISQLERPARMMTGERVAQPDFSGGEELYRRFQRDHFIGNLLSNIALPFPRTSFNRRNFSEPDDVLWHDQENRRFEGWGVFGVTVAQARMLLSTGDGRNLVFDLGHDPLPLNYSHSVLICVDADSRAEVQRPSRKVQKAYRVELSRIASSNIIISPQI
jgi:hypothetical protein